MSSSNQNNNQNINPRPCVYGCGIQIYWNKSVNEYWEVFTKKKHICPNRINNNKLPTTAGTTAISRPTYYKKPWSNTPKPKMSNSFELLQGPIETIQKKYEILSDLVTEYNGKVHGSQRDRDTKTGLIDLLVSYEVPLGQREEVKSKFENYVLIAMSD
jgi:hypothetical protein